MNVISARAPTTTAPARNDRRAWPASIEWSLKWTLITISFYRSFRLELTRS
jgi:hypothetical protein